VSARLPPRLPTAHWNGARATVWLITLLCALVSVVSACAAVSPTPAERQSVPTSQVELDENEPDEYECDFRSCVTHGRK